MDSGYLSFRQEAIEQLTTSQKCDKLAWKLSKDGGKSRTSFSEKCFTSWHKTQPTNMSVDIIIIKDFTFITQHVTCCVLHLNYN